MTSPPDGVTASRGLTAKLVMRQSIRSTPPVTCVVRGGGWDAPSGEDSSPADAGAAENASATAAARMVSARVMALSWFVWADPTFDGRTHQARALAGNPYT